MSDLPAVRRSTEIAPEEEAPAQRFYDMVRVTVGTVYPPGSTYQGRVWTPFQPPHLVMANLRAPGGLGVAHIAGNTVSAALADAANKVRSGYMDTIMPTFSERGTPQGIPSADHLGLVQRLLDEGRLEIAERGQRCGCGKTAMVCLPADRSRALCGEDALTLAEMRRR